MPKSRVTVVISSEHTIAQVLAVIAGCADFMIHHVEGDLFPEQRVADDLTNWTQEDIENERDAPWND